MRTNSKAVWAVGGAIGIGAILMGASVALATFQSRSQSDAAIVITATSRSSGSAAPTAMQLPNAPIPQTGAAVPTSMPPAVQTTVLSGGSTVVIGGDQPTRTLSPAPTPVSPSTTPDVAVIDVTLHTAQVVVIDTETPVPTVTPTVTPWPRPSWWHWWWPFAGPSSHPTPSATPPSVSTPTDEPRDARPTDGPSAKVTPSATPSAQSPTSDPTSTSPVGARATPRRISQPKADATATVPRRTATRTTASVASRTATHTPTATRTRTPTARPTATRSYVHTSDHANPPGVRGDDVG